MVKYASSFQACHLDGYWTVYLNIPGFSYHMIGIDQSEKNQGIFHKLLDIDAFGDHVKRHSLLLVPSLKLEVDFDWIVSYPKESRVRYVEL